MRRQIELVANGEVRIVVEGKIPDRHNLVLTESMFLLVAFQAHIWRNISVFLVLIEWRSYRYRVLDVIVPLKMFIDVSPKQFARFNMF